MEIIYIGKHNKMFTVEQHKHQYGEIVYCTAGVGTFTDEEGSVTHYQKGTLVLIPPGILHSNTSSEGFANFFLAISGIERLPSKIVCVADNERGDLFSIIEQAYFYFNCKTANRNTILASQGELIFHYLTLLSGAKNFSQYTELILQSIVDNFSDATYRPADFIKTLPFNPEYLSKKFARETGKSPTQQLMNMRLSHAKRLLRQQQSYGLIIKEIASACGFADALYFSRVFKAAVGKSPSEYTLTK